MLKCFRLDSNLTQVECFRMSLFGRQFVQMEFKFLVDEIFAQRTNVKDPHFFQKIKSGGKRNRFHLFEVHFV